MKKTLLPLLLGASVSLSAFADSVAQFPGGEDAMNSFIAENLKYPATAKRNGIEGVVNLSLQVKADGSIGSIKIVRMIDPDLEQEAIRLVKTMPAWTPADQGGRPVDSEALVSITFTLPEE